MIDTTDDEDDEDDEDEDEDEGPVPYDPVEYDVAQDLMQNCVVFTQSTRSSGEFVAAGLSQ